MIDTVQEQKMKIVIQGIACTVIIFLFSLYFPIIGFVCALFLPLPILIYRLKYGKANGIKIVCGTLGAILMFLRDITPDFLFFGGFLLIGWILSECIERKMSIEKMILYTCGIVVLSLISLLLLIYGLGQEPGLYTIISNYIKQNLVNTLSLYKEIGVSPEHVQVLSNSLDEIAYVLIRILPGLLISGVLVTSWLNLIMAIPLLKKWNLMLTHLGLSNQWKAPDNLVWGVIVSGIVLLVIPNVSIKLFFLNVLIILMTLFFFQGMAIVSFILNKYKLPNSIKAFCYTIIAIQQWMLFMVIGIGLFDIWFNFRKFASSYHEDADIDE
ncbi:MAG: YybS family protein [Desulfobacterales bacterium]|nr:YybS family protein [Desulfobacterales bacterium]